MTAPTNLPQSRSERPPTACWASLPTLERVAEQALTPPEARVFQAIGPNGESQVPSADGQEICLAISTILLAAALPAVMPAQVRLDIGVVGFEESSATSPISARAERAYLRRFEKAE